MNAKRRGQRALLSGNYDRAGDLLTKRRHKKAKPSKPSAGPNAVRHACVCGCSDTTKKPESFGTGFHIRLSCAGCGKFIKWLSHKAAGL